MQNREYIMRKPVISIPSQSRRFILKKMSPVLTRQLLRITEHIIAIPKMKVEIPMRLELLQKQSFWKKAAMCWEHIRPFHRKY